MQIAVLPYPMNSNCVVVDWKTVFRNCPVDLDSTWSFDQGLQLCSVVMNGNDEAQQYADLFAQLWQSSYEFDGAEVGMNRLRLGVPAFNPWNVSV